MRKTIYKEDFKDFELGELPYDKKHSALGEYHYYMPEGYFGNWYDPISIHSFRSNDGSWMITGDQSKRYLEQNRGNIFSGYFSDFSAILILKDTLYSGYHYSFDMRLFDTTNESGIVFNYITSRNYYAVSLKANEIILYYRNQKEITIIDKKKLILDDRCTYNIRLELNEICKIYVDNKIMIEASISNIPSKVGVIGRGSCRYSDIEVSMSNKEYDEHISNYNEYNKKVLEKQLLYPKLECIKKIDLKNFGTGRHLRVAHKSNGEIFFIMAQHQKRMYRDSFANISCLTAFDLEGNVMWQIGEPNNNFENTMVSCDLPFQVSDINNDGKEELIYAMNFEVCVVDLESGKLLYKMDTPLMSDYDDKYPFNRLNVDAIRVADFNGLGYQGNFILKDRYKNVFAYDENLNMIWHYSHKNTGHFPYICDFNNDGKDEMFVGYDMVDSRGNIVWSLPFNGDHTDEIIYLSTNNGEKKLYLASGNEGFNIVNMDGTIYKSIPVGHAQRISIANYNKEKVGLDICVTSFWGATDIIYMFDYDGNLVVEREMQTNGNVITPVNLDGENTLILASAHLGLLDSNLDVVVEFPLDDRPTLCSEVIDIDHDGVDEILCWDQNKMYIYKATDFKQGNIYDKYPDNAFSNYRGEYLIKKEK